jgi:ketosteroid isomerase-like protein
VLEGGDLVVDVGRMIMPQSEGKYVVVYQRQADGSLRLAVDASSHNAPRTAT